MKRRAIRPLLHVFAIALLVAAVLTGTWQQNHLFRQLAGQTPASAGDTVLARVNIPSRAHENQPASSTSRPCPRLLHLDATLSNPPIAAPGAACAVPHAPDATRRALLGLVPSVDTPPPRA
ncbi:hypothetical protein [Breoghania sp.]|uniref:hypothetical protein n=1 Tax=Breoghania sp. TaxID=2065378 RepID=UPI002AAAC334|nr:hypothetical protein [Breoghania sp.]